MMEAVSTSGICLKVLAVLQPRRSTLTYKTLVLKQWKFQQNKKAYSSLISIAT
jgi:hypothetical protein